MTARVQPEKSDAARQGKKSIGARLGELQRTALAGQRLILASNRGPVEHRFNREGKLFTRKGSGGVVTALSSLSQYLELDWIAFAMSQADRQVAKAAPGGRVEISWDNKNLFLRYVSCPGNMYHKYYSIICNPLLWFLQHYMWNSPRTPNIDRTIYDAWENGYVPVNQAFARAIVDAARSSRLPPVVMLHDYHLYLVGSYIRQQMPELIIQHFIHIPWPAPSYWQLLPGFMRQAIVSSLCNADIVGFQTKRDTLNFLHCCEEFISQAKVDYKSRTVAVDGHITLVRAYPVSIDVAGVRRRAGSGSIKKYEDKLLPLCGDKTIVRVDRVEPSKNIIRGFKAFDMLLERYPEFRGKVKFLAFLVPSRTHLKAYQRYGEEVIQLIGEINDKYGSEEWRPIDFFYENNYLQALAGMRLYDVLLVNAVIDGMNLVAKEGPTVNQRDGVLVLSETVGAYGQLGEYVLPVAPADLEGTVEALHRALVMPLAERRRRAAALRESIEKEDLAHWLLRMLEDIAVLVSQSSGQASPGNALLQLSPPE